MKTFSRQGKKYRREGRKVFVRVRSHSRTRFSTGPFSVRAYWKRANYHKDSR